MKFNRLNLEIDGFGNAAFAEDPKMEIARILREAAKKIEDDHVGGNLKDINGNTVGRWEIEPASATQNDAQHHRPSGG